MELSRLIDHLSDPRAYPFSVESVDVRQTHISAVFLAGPFVYKVKKPVAPGFLDFTTLDKRLFFCREEVRLNRRLAPDVYLDVVPVVQTGSGVRVEAEGEVIEWAVKMRRLDPEATIRARLRQEKVDAELVRALARRIASFHRTAETGDRIASFGTSAAVRRNILDVFDQAAPQAGTVVTREFLDRTRTLAEESLDRLGSLIDARAVRHVTRDCHGDLHLDHVYYLPDRAPPADLVIIDCIEFNERFRFIDPVADMAFAVMDLAFLGRRDLARVFADAYFAASEDEEGRSLLPLYSAYRAAVRGMVDGLLLNEPEVPENERAAALERSRAHWMLARVELEPPGRRPCLVLVSGIPGSGKSTLARALAAAAGFEVIRSDVVRKEIAGLPPLEPTPSHRHASVYSAETTEQTYQECLRRAERLLGEGRRAIVDASFRVERHRRTFLDAGVRRGVPIAVLHCQAEPATVRTRLSTRTGDASDADWSVAALVAREWEPPGESSRRVFHSISTEATIDQSLGRALEVLRDLDLFTPVA